MPKIGVRKAEVINTCDKCNCTISVGDKIVYKQNSNTTEIYCERCGMPALSKWLGVSKENGQLIING